MKNFDKLYLDKFAIDFDPESTAVDDFFDFIPDNDNKASQFIDEDMNELEDLFLFWKE